MRAVLFKVNQLGDNVAFVSAAQALRRSFPDWQLTVVTTPGSVELYQGPLGPQEILTSPKARFDKSHRRPWELALWMWRIRRRRPDACLVSFDQGSAAHLIARSSGAAIRVGGNIGQIRVKRSLTREIPIPGDGCPVTWNWRMAGALARSVDGNAAWPDAPQIPDLGHLLPRGPRPAGARRRVVVHSGASRPLNQWAPERFASVAKALANEFEVIWIRHGENMAPAPPGTTDAPVGTLAEFAGWAAGADLFLGNNSGPMHLANALGCPGVAVTGPSAPGWDPFWNRERWSALRHPDLACAPCERISVALAGCANLESPMACLKFWTEDKVEAACRSRLSLAGSAKP
jgi:ADP-heptose:LPS heptosyltransferase